MSMYDTRNESLPREHLAQFQLERVQALLARLRRNVRRYRDLLGDARVEVLDDVARLPATQPDDLVQAFPYGMFALPLREVVRLHSAVGPGGRQLLIGHTRNDLTQWGRLVARQLVAAGVTANDVIQICFGNGVFDEALGYMLGAEMIEASVIPADVFHIKYQLAALQNCRATVLVTTPSNARELAELMNVRRIDPQSLHLRVVILTRPVPPETREQLRTGLFAEVWSNFGIAEILDPGLCVECEHHHFHVNEDHFLVEAPDGELAVTTLCREAMPLLRYRTRTRCEIRRDRCPCGRTGAILQPGARTDGRLRVDETVVYPAQIEEVLAGTRARGQSFRFEPSERRVIVWVRVTDRLFSDTMRNLADLKREIESAFHTGLGLEAEVRYTERG